MKIGEYDIPDTAIEAALKASGKRIADETDYIKKSEAANDLVRFRKITGEDRSIEDIEKIVKAYEDNEKKSKTQTELLAAEVTRLQKELTAQAGLVKQKELEVKRRDVDKYFDGAMEATGIKVIEPILAEFKKKFVEMDESKLTPEDLKAQVTEALSKAQELQKGELLRLGIQGISPEPETPSFGGGAVYEKPSKGRELNSGNPMLDLFAITRQTSATPMGAPLLKQTPNKGAV